MSDYSGAWCFDCQRGVTTTSHQALDEFITLHAKAGHRVKLD